MGKFKTNEDYFAYSKTLTAIPSEDLAQLLESHKIKIPFYIHRFALKETLYAKVFQTQLYQTYTDELKYRLRGYGEYSLFLLEKLISDFNLDFDAAKYKEIIFDLLFLNRDLYQIKDTFLTDLEKLKYKYAVDFEKIAYLDFMKSFKNIYFEPSGYLDGVNLGIIKDVMIHSSTLGDLRGLGEKYGVKIPRRINKTQLVEILTKRFRLQEEEITLLNTKSVLELEIYAKEKGFNISIDLKKSDMIEYLVYSLNLYHQEIMKDIHDYRIPLTAELDAVKIDAIEFEQNDQDIPVEGYEPKQVVKEEVPPVVTENVEEEPVVIVPITQEEEVQPLPEPVLIEEVVEPVENKKVEEVVEPVKTVEPAPVAKVVEEPKKEPCLEEARSQQVQKVSEAPVKKPEEVLDFSEEEKALLDEKINQIIKKYNKKRHKKVFWTVFFSIILGVILLAVGYSALYYFYLTPGNLPF